jgi:hypothetical protein
VFIMSTIVRIAIAAATAAAVVVNDNAIAVKRKAAGLCSTVRALQKTRVPAVHRVLRRGKRRSTAAVAAATQVAQQLAEAAGTDVGHAFGGYTAHRIAVVRPIR